MASLLAMVLLGGCLETQRCKEDGECLEHEVCDLTSSVCVENPCFGQVDGYGLTCDGTTLAECQSGLKLHRDCGEPGCNAQALRCNECTPGSGSFCDGDRWVACDFYGLVADTEDCPNGCEVLWATRAQCLPYCTEDDDCLDDEVCHAESYTCEPNPCFNHADGTFLACDGTMIFYCEDERAVHRDCGAPNGCNAQAGRCNECVPSLDQCQGDQLIPCGSDGLIVAYVSCEFGCNRDRLACNDCTPSQTECYGDTLVECKAGGDVSRYTLCVLGCDDGVSPAACRTFPR